MGLQWDYKDYAGFQNLLEISGLQWDCMGYTWDFVDSSGISGITVGLQGF